MTLKALKCKKCEAIIYSRARHDFHWCPCGNLAVDGGRDYMKISFKEPDSYEQVEVEVKADAQKLYDDWNLNKNKFGTILKK